MLFIIASLFAVDQFLDAFDRFVVAFLLGHPPHLCQPCLTGLMLLGFMLKLLFQCRVFLPFAFSFALDFFFGVFGFVFRFVLGGLAFFPGFLFELLSMDLAELCFAKRNTTNKAQQSTE